MEIILSAAVSLDGYIDDCSPRRLKLSGPEDWKAVEELRAVCDAVLVGAGTVRKDNPSLVIKKYELRSARVKRGMPADIDKIVVTNSGNLDPDGKFFREGGGNKIIICSRPELLNPHWGEVAEVIVYEDISAPSIREILAAKGYRKVLVEGGTSILTMFMRDNNFDRLRLAVAPFFVGEQNAPRLVGAGGFVSGKGQRLHLESTQRVGDMAVMLYYPYTSDDEKFLQKAIDESRKSLPDRNSYRVGAVVRTRDGNLYTGFTHESGTRDHAEEEAVKKAEAAGADLSGATMYSSMEPCSERKSKSRSCSQIIIDKGFARVVFAVKEPGCFVECRGMEVLRSNGVEVIHIHKLGNKVLEINDHLLA